LSDYSFRLARTKGRETVSSKETGKLHRVDGAESPRMTAFRARAPAKRRCDGIVFHDFISGPSSFRGREAEPGIQHAGPRPVPDSVRSRSDRIGCISFLKCRRSGFRVPLRGPGMTGTAPANAHASLGADADKQHAQS
jgi:hypothetical protein